MCDICHQSICPRGCPNEPPPKTVYDCVWCGRAITEGEDYYEIDGQAWCEGCIKECRTTAEL